MVNIYCAYLLVRRTLYDFHMRFFANIYCAYLIVRRKILRLYWADAIEWGLTGRG